MKTSESVTARSLERFATATPNAKTEVSVDWESELNAACERACQAIAPAWPLDRAIAVNPHWSRVGLPLRRVAARMAVLGGIQVFPTRESQQEAWLAGRIGADDLEYALPSSPSRRNRH